MSKNAKTIKSTGKGKKGAAAAVVETVIAETAETGTFADTSRHSEARANTALTTADLPAVEGAAASSTRATLLSVMLSNVEGLKALAAALPAGSREMPEKTAGQWARLRNSITQGFADNFDNLRDTGILTAAQHEGAIKSLRDSEGNSAPIYGAQKLVDTIALLSSGNRAHVSKLHSAYLDTLCSKPTGSDFSNEELAKGIARRAVCSVTGTAPTQRSSSNFALAALGIIEATRIGARMLDNAASRAVRAVYAPAS